MSMKNPLIPAGIEPATFRFVAQHLNHCATVVPLHLFNMCHYRYTAQYCPWADQPRQTIRSPVHVSKVHGTLRTGFMKLVSLAIVKVTFPKITPFQYEGGRGSNLGGGEIFRTRRDWSWDPPFLLYNGYQVFPGGKAAEAWRWPLIPI